MRTQEKPEARSQEPEGGSQEPRVRSQKADGEGWARVAMVCAGVAGVFCVVIAAQLMGTLLQDKARNPLVAGPLAELKAELAQQPKDGKIKDQIRAVDQQIRVEFLVRRAKMARGSWLLLGGAVAMVVAMKAGRRLGKRMPTAEGVQALGGRGAEEAWARWAVMGAGAGVVGLMVAATLTPGVAGLNAAPQAKGPGAAAPTVVEVKWPEKEALMRNWPVFRGWGGAGVAAGENWPEKWDGKTGEGIVWKAEVPLEGKNSPIVWEDKVFLSAATEEKRVVVCYSAVDGKLLWQQEVAENNKSAPPEVSEEEGFAAPTMATDGARVFAIFPTGDIAGFDLTGKRLWQRNLGKVDNGYGLAASLTVWQNRVIVQLDVGKDADEKSRSALLALDGRTGKTVWQTKRPVMASWASPVVAEAGGVVQVVTISNPWIMGYDAGTGQELWRANEMGGGDVAASPAVVNGVVYFANESAAMGAIRAEGKGDVTKTQVAWANSDESMPDLVSPASNGELLWTIPANGTIYCWDAKNGKKVWEHDTKALFHMSPMVVGKHVWVINTKGVLHVLEAGREYKEVGTAELGEEVSASPALAGGNVFIRGKKNLYCIGKK